MLKGFSKDGRDLTDAETKAFLNAADKDGDGKIGIDGERGKNMSRSVTKPLLRKGEVEGEKNEWNVEFRVRIG